MDKFETCTGYAFMDEEHWVPVKEADIPSIIRPALDISDYLNIGDYNMGFFLKYRRLRKWPRHVDPPGPSYVIVNANEIAKAAGIDDQYWAVQLCQNHDGSGASLQVNWDGRVIHRPKKYSCYRV
jgi:hypothetical protein